MPIYEYQCRRCEHYLDVLQKVSDPLLTDCPECGEPALKRLMSAPNFRLKGGGWYETDFKSGNRRNIADGGEAADKEDKKKDKEKEAEKPKAGKEPPAAGGGKTGAAKPDGDKDRSKKKPSGDDKAA